MNVTDDMLQAAIRKAIEAGLLPRRSCREEADVNRELIRLVVMAALRPLSPASEERLAERHS